MNNIEIHLKNGEIIRSAPLKMLPAEIVKYRPHDLTSFETCVWDLDAKNWRKIPLTDIVSQNITNERYGLL